VLAYCFINSTRTGGGHGRQDGNQVISALILPAGDQSALTNPRRSNREIVQMLAQASARPTG